MSGPVTRPVPGSMAPAPRPRARRRLITAHALLEARLLLRNGEQLLLSLAIPLGLLVLGRFAGGGLIGLSELAPSVIALALWSSAFTATAIATGFERRYGVLERLATTPLTRTGLIIGKTGGVVVVAVLQLVVVSVVAVLLGWRPTPTPLAAALLVPTTLAAMTAGVALALLLAGRLRAEATLALANLVHLLLAVGGGLVVPIERYPAPLAAIAAALPTGALGRAWRLLADPAAAPTTALLALMVAAIWAAVSVGLASRLFRWIS